jgi:hypothetical protein
VYIVVVGDNPFDQQYLVTAKEVGGPMVTGSTDSLRLLGWCSVVLSVLWIWGLGSFVGATLGLIGVLARGRVTVDPPPGLRLCVAGLVLGLIGLAAAIIWFYP